MENDDPIANPDTYTVAVVAQQLLTMSEALSAQYGEEAVRDAALVAYLVLGERELGYAGILAELRGKITALTESPTVEAAVHKWLH